jgi:hypothetical protein
VLLKKTSRELMHNFIFPRSLHQSALAENKNVVLRCLVIEDKVTDEILATCY